MISSYCGIVHIYGSLWSYILLQWPRQLNIYQIVIFYCECMDGQEKKNYKLQKE